MQIITNDQISKNLGSNEAVTAIQDFLLTYANPHELLDIRNYASMLRDYENVYFIGIGGAILPSQVLLSFIDPKKIIIIDDVINSSEFIPKNNSSFVVISKSGQTIETIYNIKILAPYMTSKNTLFITNSNSNIGLYGKKHEYIILDHPPISGRYSIFTIVGLLAAAVELVDLDELLSAAKSELIYPNAAAIMNVDMINKNVHHYILMSYSNRFYKIQEYFRQIWSESIGKNGINILPHIAYAAKDHHSQLQMYLNVYDKIIFATLALENRDSEYDIFMQTLLNNTLQAIQNSHMRNIYCKTTTYDLGYLLINMMTEVILTCKMLNIDPYNQPHIDKMKKDISTNILL